MYCQLLKGFLFGKWAAVRRTSWPECQSIWVRMTGAGRFALNYRPKLYFVPVSCLYGKFQTAEFARLKSVLKNECHQI
jgi:hypothetical protein